MLFSNRNSRRNLLIEVNPYQILAAAIDRPDNGPVKLEAVAEFDAQDDAGLREWLEANFDRQKAWVPCLGGFTAPEALLQRDSIHGRRLLEPDYLPNLVKEQYRIEDPAGWRLSTLHPLDGVTVAPEGVARPALICGVSHSDVHLVQQRLLDHRLLPYRLELSLLPLLGVIADYKAHHNDKRAAVVVVIEQEHTTAYILGKEGVHTPGPVRHGFSSIVQAACKEFGLKEADEIRDRLQHADDELLLRASKFVRAIGRDLKPLVDSYEMTTGQPVGEIYCAYLPAALSWIAEPLAQVVGRTPFVIDVPAWMPTVKLEMAEGVAPLGQHWLGALSLVAEPEGPKPDKAPKENDVYQGPWHLDCRISGALPSNDIVRSRFITNVVAATLAAAAFVFTLWQIYVSRELSADTSFWEQRIADNKRETDALNQTTRTLKAASDRIDRVNTLMATPYTVSTMVISTGQTRPAALRIDDMISAETGLVLRGTLREPSQSARQTLSTYMDQLRRDPVVGPVFANITLTSFVRKESSDGAKKEGPEVFDFELTMKLKPAAP